MSIFWNPMEAVDLLEMPLPIITEGTQDMGNGVYWLRAGTPLDEYFAVANNEDAKYLVAEDFYFYSNKPDQAKVVPLITAGYIDINKAEEAAGITYSDECLVALEQAGIILAAATIALSETQIQESVDNWLDEHPEATTTVQDGSITKVKLDENLQGKIDEVDDLKSALGNVNGSQVKTNQIDYTSVTITPNKKITGYDAQTFVPTLGNEAGSYVADFAIADLAKYGTIKFPRCTKSGQWFILYSDSLAWNFTKSNTSTSANKYDLSNANYGIIYCTWLLSTSYTRVAMAFDGAVDITSDTGFDTFFELMQSANQNKNAVPEIRKIYYESTIDISVKSANVTIPYTIFKDETLTFVNNTTGNTALYAVDTDGTLVTISTGLAPDSRTTFTAGKDYYRLRYWSQQLGTVTVRNANSVIATKQVDAENAQMASVNMFESIAAIGDSYTAGSVKNSAGTWSDVRNLSWIATMGKRSGTTWKNYGHGGATTKSYLETTEFANALSDTACDLYFFALGQNDGNQTLTIGTVADIHDADYTQNPDTFYGNYGRIIQQIKTHAPNAKLVMIKNWVQGATWTDYDTAIEGIATHYSIPVISPFDDYFFNSALYQDYKEYGHPTAMGYSSMGLAMERLFSKCVVNNPSYFKFATIG